MGELDGLSVREVISTLKRLGFTDLAGRGKGSHHALTRIDSSGNSVLAVVPQADPVPIGTVRAILRECGISRDEFLGGLRRR